MNLGVDIYKKILKGELKRFPNRFWVDPGAEEHAKQITKYLIEEILKWGDEEVKENISEMVFRKHKLSGMLEYTFGRSPFKALDNAYPNHYKEWELKTVPKNLWENEKKQKEATEWLLEKTNKSRFEELTNLDFINNGLGGLLDSLYKSKDFTGVKSVTGSEIFKKATKVSFNKSGGTAGKGGVTTRVTLPTRWVRDILGVTEDEREVTISIVGRKIIIENEKNKEFAEDILVSTIKGNVYFYNILKRTTIRTLNNITRNIFNDKHLECKHMHLSKEALGDFDFIKVDLEEYRTKNNMLEFYKKK